MAYLTCNESFINPTYGERMGLTYRQAKGKLSLKDKIRLKLMKYLGRSRNSLKDKLQDKSLQAAGYVIKKGDKAKNYIQKNPKNALVAGLGVLGAGYVGKRGYEKYKLSKAINAAPVKTQERIIDDISKVPTFALEMDAKKGNAEAIAELKRRGK